MDLPERFWEKVDATGDCWEWTASTVYGYGQFWMNGTRWRAHRLACEFLTGQQIPADKQIDHLCRNKACVNPDHLEVVTQRENIMRSYGVTARNARATHCKRGHSLAPDNVYIHDGRRVCKECAQARRDRRRGKA